MNRRAFLQSTFATTTALSLTGCSFAADTPRPAAKPNVLMLLSMT